MAYKINNRGEDALVFDYLAGAPRQLRAVAEYARREDSLENLEAYLLLQYIDSRAVRRKPVDKEYALLMTDYFGKDSSAEINVGSALKRQITWASMSGTDRSVRDNVLVELSMNLADLMSRFDVDGQFELPKVVLKRGKITEHELLSAYQMVRGIGGKAPAGSKEISEASGLGLMRLVNKVKGY